MRIQKIIDFVKSISLKKYLLMPIDGKDKNILFNVSRIDFISEDDDGFCTINQKSEPPIKVIVDFSSMISLVRRVSIFGHSGFLLLTNKQTNRMVLINPLRYDYVKSSNASLAIFVAKSEPIMTVKESYLDVIKLLKNR